MPISTIGTTKPHFAAPQEQRERGRAHLAPVAPVAAPHPSGERVQAPPTSGSLRCPPRLPNFFFGGLPRWAPSPSTLSS